MGFNFLSISCLVLAFLSHGCNAMKCYQCKASVGDCVDGQCPGTWCTAIITEDKTTNSRTVEKGCAQVNPSGNSVDGCLKEVNGQTTIQKCGCQLEEFCNSEAGITRLLSDKNGGVPSGFNSGIGGVNLPNITGGAIQPTGNVPLAPFAAGPNQPFVPGNTVNGPPPPKPLPGQPPLPGQGPQVDPNNGGQIDTNNTNPALPRFPPPNTQPNNNNNFPPQQPNPNVVAGQTNPNPGFIGGAGVNVINNGNNQQAVPIGGAGGGSANTLSPIAEPEPTGKNNFTWSTTSQSPNAINGQQSANLADVSKPVSHGDKYTCSCYGPAYCSGNKCKGDYCAVIEFSPLDLARSPGSPPVESSNNGPVTHLGCAGTSEVSGGNTQRSFPVTQYEVVSKDGRRNFVKANERVCTGDFCNSSSPMKKISVLFSIVLATSALLLAR